MRKKFGTFAACAVAISLLASACSGGDDTASPSAEEIADDPAAAPIEQRDDDSGATADGPISGLLTVQPSFGFGLWDVDRATGEARAVPGIAAVETIGRNNDLVIGDGAAYTIGGRTREGQSFSSDVSVVKIDYATGEVSQLAELGFDRETDDSPGLTSYRVEAVAGGPSKRSMPWEPTSASTSSVIPIPGAKQPPSSRPSFATSMVAWSSSMVARTAPC